MLNFFPTKNPTTFQSHNNGLTEVQVKWLQSLKPGDRLVMFKNQISPETWSALFTVKRSSLPNIASRTVSEAQ